MQKKKKKKKRQEAHDYHHVVPQAWISLSLSHHFYRSSPLAGLQGYIPYPHPAAVCMYVRAGRPALTMTDADYADNLVWTKLNQHTSHENI